MVAIGVIIGTYTGKTAGWQTGVSLGAQIGSGGRRDDCCGTGSTGGT